MRLKTQPIVIFPYKPVNIKPRHAGRYCPLFPVVFFSISILQYFYTAVFLSCSIAAQPREYSRPVAWRPYRALRAVSRRPYRALLPGRYCSARGHYRPPQQQRQRRQGQRQRQRQRRQDGQKEEEAIKALVLVSAACVGAGWMQHPAIFSSSPLLATNGPSSLFGFSSPAAPQ